MKTKYKEHLIIESPRYIEPKWEEWFAWYPVKIKTKWYWLQKLYRKPIPFTYSNYDDWQRYFYGTLFEVISE